MENKKNYLVVGISSRALFNLEEENRIYEEKGLQEYSDYQIKHENDILKPGAGFLLVKSLLRINSLVTTKRKAEIIIMSKNNPNTSLRIFNSIKYYDLDITRAALVGGASISPYLSAFNIDLFLSADEKDVQEAINAGIAAGVICTQPEFPIDPEEEINQKKLLLMPMLLFFQTNQNESIGNKV